MYASVRRDVFCLKGYLPAWTEEVFIIVKRTNRTEPIYEIEDLNAELIAGTFYEAELQRIQLPEEFRVEKVLRKKKEGKKLCTLLSGWVGTIHSIRGFRRRICIMLQMFLPSTACIDYYPDNKPSNYTVKLAGAVEGYGMECALTEISSPNRLINVREGLNDVKVYRLVRKKGLLESLKKRHKIPVGH